MKWWEIGILRQRRKIKEIQIIINILVKTDWEQSIVARNKP